MAFFASADGSIVISPVIRLPWAPKELRRSVTTVWTLTLDDGRRMDEASANRLSVPKSFLVLEVAYSASMRRTQYMSFHEIAVPE